ncbi:hypothetical protein Pst134EB_023674 [Puccinia striiformis f. sp. tritici]|nr:hypothetical protein Pst134EB_023674 [Puccinia striiformis f. sp. tritici]
MKFLLALSGFGWKDTTQMVTADGDTWDELIKQHPKRLFPKLRRSTVPSYNLAEELFVNGTYATGPTALQPGQAPPKNTIWTSRTTLLLSCRASQKTQSSVEK